MQYTFGYFLFYKCNRCVYIYTYYMLKATGEFYESSLDGIGIIKLV